MNALQEDDLPSSAHDAEITASIVIPTFNRHFAVARALASAVAQRVPSGAAFEIVVVDNSPDANARDVITPIAAASPVPVHYLSQPNPGVATARNAGIARARGRWIAFLDDDEEASTHWLASLLAVAARTRADAVFGPVAARAESDGDIGPFESFFSRRIPLASTADITAQAPYLGTNNSLFNRARCFPEGAPFETGLDRTGGEDSLLLRRLVLGGRRFAWAADATVTEWVPPRRLTWAYVRKRRFLSGQIRSFVHAMAEPAKVHNVAKWMIVGAAQFVLAGSGAILARPFKADLAERLRSIAYGGLGKVLWMERFRPGLYGSGLVS
jgi:succinoglycan biosynthesis protein ExoM